MQEVIPMKRKTLYSMVEVKAISLERMAAARDSHSSQPTGLPPRIPSRNAFSSSGPIRQAAGTLNPKVYVGTILNLNPTDPNPVKLSTPPTPCTHLAV